MTDIDLMQNHIRAANPIPRVDDLDPDELAAFIAAVHTRRSAIMQTPTQHKPQPSTAAPTARRRVWAFAAGFATVLLVIGAATLVLRGDDTPVANERATPTTVTGSKAPTTGTTGQGSPMVGVDPDVFLDAWQPVASGEAWVGSIVDVEPLPDGGFVAMTWAPDPRSVVWSPDGVEWHDGDPRQLVPGFPAWVHMNEQRSLEVTADQVVVLDQVNIGVWVGDPKVGDWELVRLDTSGFDGRWGTMAMAANDREVLVVAGDEIQDVGDEERSTSQVVIWLIDTSEGTSTRTSLPVTTGPDMRNAQFEWFNDRWIMLVPLPPSDGCSVWMSSDGASWTETAPPDRLDSCGGSITAGPSGVVVTRSSWGGDDILYSPDGRDWEVVYDRSAVAKATYSQTLGYVVEVTVDHEDETEDGDPGDDGVAVSEVLALTDGDAILVSTDGKTWQLAGPARPKYGMDFLLAASDGRLLVRDDAFALWLWTND